MKKSQLVRKYIESSTNEFNSLESLHNATHMFMRLHVLYAPDARPNLES